MKRIILGLLSAIIFFSSVFAQTSPISNYVTRSWTSSDGLPGNSVSDIIQTTDGFMYFGTYECLVRFDGNEFKTMNKYTDNSLSFISARSVFLDSTGAMWVGSNDEGAQKITSEAKITYSTKEGLPNNSIRSFAEDKQHNIWIGTAGGVVYLTPQGDIITPVAADNENLNHIIVNQLFSDSSGRIWLLTNESNGIYQYSSNAFHRFHDLDSVGTYMVSTVAQDSSGALWFSLGRDGIYKIDNGVAVKIKTGTILDTIPTNTIYCDKSGSLWFGTEKGLVVAKDGSFIFYNENASLNKTSINKILEDREGNTWIATDNAGIFKINQGKLRMNKLETAVNAICEDKQGLIWIGTDEGLLCYDNGQLIDNELTEYIGEVRVRHLGLTKEGNLLVSCYSKPGQVMDTPDAIYSWSTDEGLAGNKTRVAIEASDGKIYVGTTTGLSIITVGDEEDKIDNHTINTDFECEYVMCLYEDENGDIWVGTDGGGIYILRNGKIVLKFSTDDGLAGNVIFKIIQDEQGIYWICTGSGISRWDGANFINYNSATGLGSDSIFQMIIDHTDTVWMVSNRGISTVSLSDMNDVANGTKLTVDSKFYTENDGLKSQGPNSTALSMMDQYGRIWLTLSDGFAIYDPLKEKTQKVVPLIQIEYVKIDDKVITDYSVPIVIPAGAKHIDIKYTGLSFTACERNRYTYIMDGFDENYSDFTANLTASYTSLKPGAYTFKVNILNGEGILAENEAQVFFIQKAFFYQLPVFWIGLSAFLIIVVVLIFILTKRSYIKRQLQLETRIQMATVELEIAKDDSDRLLKNILPVSIAKRMKGLDGEKTIAESYTNVTVLFADIVGFTNTTSHESAETIVSSLNDLISRFDKRADKMGVEKIKTIGDAYMAACGVPEPNPEHSKTMLQFAIGMYKDLEEYNRIAKIKFNIRIGLSAGPVIAGVIGKNKFVYDIWGDTVNVASRMEHVCTPGYIRITESVKTNIETTKIHLKCREIECDIKGKGIMKTYELPDIKK